MKRSGFVEKEFERLGPVAPGKPLGDLAEEEVEYDPSKRRQKALWRALRKAAMAASSQATARRSTWRRTW